MNNHFDILLLLARPAAGKSEVMHYLKHLTSQERLARFHLGSIVELDDFPMLWTWFEEDDLLESMGYPRLHTDTEGYFVGNHLWHLLVKRIGLDYQKLLRDQPDLHKNTSVLVEFSRGTEHGGYADAFQHIPEMMLKRMCILYLDVSWEESLRKNRKRFNPNKPDSILEHGLPDEKLEKLYRENDWVEITQNAPDVLNIHGIKVPFVTVNNEDDVTTHGGEKLGNRLEAELNKLWHRACTLR
jgi:hypothetical protein